MKKKTLIQVWIFLAGLIFTFSNVGASENHADQLISDILNTRQAIINSTEGVTPNSFVFLAFWDFDGTILRGDCSEGLMDGSREVYEGLAVAAIKAGLSEIYAPQNGAERFWQDYRHMEKHIGEWLAYPFIVQMLRGAKESDVRTLAARHFEKVFRHYYFASSLKILKALEENGIENHVISASADVFVGGAAPTLGLPEGRFNGIQVAIENGRLTEKLVYPVTWSHGKTQKLISIVNAMSRRYQGKKVFVLAAFGDSYSTDGPFMRYVVSQVLPAGKPLAVMINAQNAPVEFRGLFIAVRQSEMAR